MPIFPALLLLVQREFNLGCFGPGLFASLALDFLSVAQSITHVSLGTVSNTFIAFHTPPHLGGTALVFWFGRVMGTWPQAPVAADTTPLARSAPRDC